MDESARQQRAEAYRLTEEIFGKMNPRPLRSVEQVAPIVFKMLQRGIKVSAIEMAITNASVLTPGGIEYALNQTARLPGGAKAPRYEPIPPAEPLTEDQKRRNVAHVRELREQLRSDKG